MRLTARILDNPCELEMVGYPLRAKVKVMLEVSVIPAAQGVEKVNVMIRILAGERSNSLMTIILGNRDDVLRWHSWFGRLDAPPLGWLLSEEPMLKRLGHYYAHAIGALCDYKVHTAPKPGGGGVRFFIHLSGDSTADFKHELDELRASEFLDLPTRISDADLKREF